MIRFASSDNADENALSSSLFEYVIVASSVEVTRWIQSNNVEATCCCFHRISVFRVRFLVVKNRFHQDTSQDGSQEMWQTQAAHQSNNNYECDDYIFEFENDYIFVFATEVNEKTTIELDDVPEENYVTVYVKTTQWKDNHCTKCDKKQKAASFSEEVERRSWIPRGMTYLVHHGTVMNEKKTIEENNIGAGTTIEMSLRLLGGMDESDMKDTSETEEGEKRENWKKQVKANRRERAKNQHSYKKE